ncbi:MAG: hypothetical protein OEU95_03390 [Nitrospirota bacterium]|nr:hypothetical protein [Nitrospirota bacterium]
MTSCRHSVLILLPGRKNMLRCRRCHLLITPDELKKGHCPECFEVSGNKQYDFEEVAAGQTGTDRYRCEECGVIIESDQ